ncbi:MAG: SUMF1/EgtB/PvdO family nonheme iron enzyme [Beijerinckiaceae bacterium]
MVRRLVTFAFVFFTVACAATIGVRPALAEKRVALIIGNGAYAHAQHLPNPAHDAEDVAAALKRSGFETIVGRDLDKAKMDEAAIEFARAARTADVAVFYYSGHAMQFAGVNYLVPVDAKLADEADLRRLARVDEIVADLQQAKNLRILVLDSCRNNPLAEDLKRSIGASRAVSLQRGLAKFDTPEGMIVSYATQAGRTAEDGTGRNSPYTAAFLKHIEEQDEIGTIFRRVATDVYESTGRNQLPELSISIIGEFYLHGHLDVTGPARPPTADPCATAESHWKSAEAIGTIAAFEDHLARFPNCTFAGLAKARIESLRPKVAVVVPPPPAISARCGGAVLASLGSRAAAPLSVEEECALKPNDEFKECATCPPMVVVPPGSFTMGSPATEPGRFDNEGPQHVVSFAKSFAVGKFQVTRDEFAAFVNETAYDAGSKCWTFEEGKAEERSGRSWRNPGFAQTGAHPVACLNWNDAQAYVAWLAKKTGKTYRLLSESEWEYAARGQTLPGAYPRYFFGDAEKDMCRYGNGADQTAKEKVPGLIWAVVPCNDGYAYTSPVGSFLPNAFGLYDMHGNVWQWVEDCYAENYQGAPTDGSAKTTGECSRRVLRGGSWNYNPRYLRAALRFWLIPVNRYDSYGFRLARTLNL